MDTKKEIKFNLAVLGKNKTIKQPTYGCLKGGKTPTFRQTRSIPSAPSISSAPTPKKAARPNTIKHYTSFGKKNNTVRVLIKGGKDIKSIDNEKRKLEKHSLADICTYLASRNLYTPGSNAPEDVLREIYRNAYLAGNVSNSNPERMIENYMAEKLTDVKESI
jgi:hypothetical protein